MIFETVKYNIEGHKEDMKPCQFYTHKLLNDIVYLTKQLLNSFGILD